MNSEAVTDQGRTSQRTSDQHPSRPVSL